jgi:hypothetical protein
MGWIIGFVLTLVGRQAILIASHANRIASLEKTIHDARLRFKL